LAAVLLLASCVTPTAPPVEIPEADVLPLALDNDFDFRKVRRTINQAGVNTVTDNETLNFERAYLNHGALSADERRQREGTYFDIFWRAARPAELTVRFEYRQAKTGNAETENSKYKADMEKLQRRMETLLRRYNQQFAAMESLVGSVNAQKNSLKSTFEGMMAAYTNK
jgi:hypothetical protein